MQAHDRHRRDKGRNVCEERTPWDLPRANRRQALEVRIGGGDRDRLKNAAFCER
jgi:hypothetical protein